ncbi:MAG: hypothetical protein JNL74_13620 [Fibrobacteres bacterium]|nr:hypothetical protein [Fibrobacterota bacterium]
MELSGITGLDRLRRARATDAYNVGKGGAKLSLPRTDTVEISSKNTESRSMLIESVKAKIKKGFYSGEAVADDVADKLAKLFDR